jgi:23S rRNA-/tRNA-specific pseudouridylate synthase/SAM-dependent methyltransferase
MVGRDARRKFLPAGIEILHEDEDLIVVDKPPGVLTVDLEDRDRENVFDLVKRHVRDVARKRGTKVWVVHRLDKEASGLIVFAKTQKAFHWLKEDFKAKRVHRLYAAVIEGEVPMPPGSELSAQTDDGEAPASTKPRKVVQAPSGVIQSFLQEGHDGVVRSVPGPSSGRAPVHTDDEAIGDGPRHAITHWKAQEVGSGRTLLQIRLETGRKNQIRAHMREFGRPIVGDRRYGAATDPLGRVCLHAFELGFTNPLNGKPLRFRSPTPGSFFGLVGKNPGSDSRVAKDLGESARQPLPGLIQPPAPVARVAKAEVATLKPREPIAAAKAEVEEAPERPVRTPSPTIAAKDPSGQSWDHVAEWYDELIEDRKSDHHERVIIPGALRLLGDVANMRVLDVACGQGVLSRRLVELGARVVGVDAAPKLIDSAIRLGWANGPAVGANVTENVGAERLRYLVGDARSLDAAALIGDGEAFDVAACVMALMNIEPLSPVMDGVAKCLAPGGRFISVILHPAFRAPGQTSWGWEKQGDSTTPAGAPQRTGPEPRRGAGAGGRNKPNFLPRDARRATIDVRQYRRVDGYLSLGQRSIIMNPGAAAHGKDAVTTVTYHRPIQAYVKAFAEAGLLLDGLEEWTSMRTSEPGPRAAEEDRARREIPMFLAMRGVKIG